MKRIVGINISMNLVLMMIFVTLNKNTLKNGFEETFITLAVIYGIIVVVTNAVFIDRFCKK